ncbi:MAG TPA: PQQ-binding-like beta-propeller repeat protein [Steroidobacteraceae bacterium]|nr:PQQ-binding-like beta-propeller repeat protein [Steroidobacteraceae bacterium]
MQTRRLAGTAALLVAGWLGMSMAQAAAPKGSEVFQRVCAGCHTNTPPPARKLGEPPPDASALAPRAVPPDRLKLFTPEAILNALTNGKMQTQAASLSPAERRAVAEFASGQTFSASAAARKNSLCKSVSPMTDIDRGPRWLGWGNGVENVRYQPQEQGKLTAADLPKLELKWAFGYANIGSARAAPTVVGNRLFAASENAEVQALDPKSGCTYWTYKADFGVRVALSVGHYRGGTAVYFADTRANVYALDANTGKLIWKTKVDQHPMAGVTGAPVFFDGKLYVPVQGISEEGTGSFNNYSCCTFRGNLTALDGNTGEIVWKTYTVDETRPTGKSKTGVQMYGPAGGSIWSPPTIDAKRRLIYVGTGNGYADPPQKMTDAVVAMDLDTGAIKWFKQILPNDSWAMGCKAKNPDNPACPATLGPDFDFSAPPALIHTTSGDRLVLPQKSGLGFALDPDAQGKVLWQYRFGQGSGLGGQWGTSTDGELVFFGTADMLTPTPGGMHAVRIADGSLAWKVPPQAKLCGDKPGCSAGQGSATTVIPGAVLSSGMDGGLRAYSTKDGSILWLYDTNKEFTTVNGVRARGGSMDGAGPVVVDGMMYVNSGYGGLIGVPGNVLLAFGID